MHHQRNQAIPAPCIIDEGTIVNKEDIKRLLNDLGHVRYVHIIDDRVKSKGKGWVMEILNDPLQSTIVANNNLYLNLQSFDCLQLGKSQDNETYFDLVQDNRQLRLIPLANNTLEKGIARNIDAATIEAMMGEVLSARFDVQFDDEDLC